MTDRSELASYFGRYATAFDAFDFEAIAAFYAVPCLMVRSGSVAAHGSREVIVANMKGLVELYRSQGYQRAPLTDLHAIPLGAGLALVTVAWSIDLKNGLPQSFRNTYELAELDGEWRIVVSTLHDSGGVSA